MVLREVFSVNLGGRVGYEETISHTRISTLKSTCLLHQKWRGGR